MLKPAQADSLQQLLPQTTGANRLSVLYELVIYSQRVNVAQVAAYENEAWHLAQSLNTPSALAMGYFIKGYTAGMRDELETSFISLRKAQDLAQHTQLPPRQQFMITLSLAEAYAQTKHQDKATQSFNAALALAKENGLEQLFPYAYYGLGELYVGKLKFDSARMYFQKAELQALALNDSLAMLKAQDALAFWIRDPDKALEVHQKLLSSFEKAGYAIYVPNVYFSIGWDYLKLGNGVKAEEIYTLCLAQYKATEQWARVAAVHKQLAKAMALQGRHKEALAHYERRTTLTDSLYNRQAYWRIGEAEADYAVAAEEEKTAAAQATVKAQNRFLALMAAALVFLGFTITMVLWAHKQRKKALRLVKRQKRETEALNATLEQRHDEILTQAESLRAQNAQIEQQKGELEAVNGMKSRMLSIISHDFRSPLNSLRGSLPLLRSNTLTPQEFEAVLQNIDNRLGYNLNLIDNLLGWTRSQLGGTCMKPQRVNINSLACDVHGLLAPMALEKGIQFNVSAPMVHADADADMLHLVLRNLLSNALKFTKRGGSVCLHVDIENENLLCFRVKDTGTGMSEEMMAGLFNAHGNRSRLGTQNEKGIGLGLLLCQEYLAMHSSTLNVESTLGEGSCFSFNLPVAQEIIEVPA